MKVLVTGGVRSGKSWHAEQLLAGHERVTYVAPGPTPEEEDDPDWAERIAAHRARRPDTWTTLETRDLAGALRTDGPLLVDCLGTWLTAVLDEHQLWEASAAEATTVIDARLDDVVEALAGRTEVVIVTNEVGLGVVPSHRSGRVFRDLLGTVNRRVAESCDEVHLVVSGRVLVL